MNRAPGVAAATLSWVLANPEAARAAIRDEKERRRVEAALERKEEAERSLGVYTELVWHVVEPSRQLVRGWALDAINDHLQAITEGHIRRLLLNVPPGFMKSLATNVFWPSWEWGPRRMPHLRYLSASYSANLTVRDNVRCRDVTASDVYQRLWGDRFGMSRDQNAKVNFATDRTGWKLATSVGGVGTGARGDRVIIDDPHNVLEAESDAMREEALRWFAETMPTRHNDQENPIVVVIMQRVHENDVSGLILARELDYVHVCIPMEYRDDHPVAGRNAKTTPIGWRDPREPRLRLESGEPMGPFRHSRDGVQLEGDGALARPELLTTKGLEDLKRQLSSFGGDYAIAGQLDQWPVARNGGECDVDKIVMLDEPPPLVGTVVRCWDLAGSTGKRSPYTAGIKMGWARDGRLVILNARRARVLSDQMYALLEATARDDGRAVRIRIPQDPGQAGKGQVLALIKLLHGYTVTFRIDSGDKVVRARPFFAQVNAGNVAMVRGHWNDDLKHELRLVPAGQYKDQMDACSGAYIELLALGAPGDGGHSEVVSGEERREERGRSLLSENRTTPVVFDEWGGIESMGGNR